MMASILERIGRKSLALRNRLIKPREDEIHHLVEMMQNSPRGYSDAQDWTLQLASLLARNLLDRVSRKDLALILAGLVSYRNTGVTPQRSHIALMHAYENSSGLMQQVLHTILFSEKIEKVRFIQSAYFGDVHFTEIDAILSELDQRGYVVLPRRMQKHWVEAFVSEAREFNYILRNPSNDETSLTGRKIDPNDPPQCVAAYANSSDIANSQLLSDFCNDPLLLHLASRHMGAKVQPIDSTLWYSFSSSEPSADAAQLFHYDLDTLRWLKVFVYLTDVGPDNGPHEYVPGSHRPGAKPFQLMNRDYARLGDQEIDKYCAQPRKAILGECGTVVLGDTRCFHKGNAVKSSYRLIYAPIYSASKIGYFNGS